MTTQSSLQYSFTFTQSHTHSYSASISSTLLFYVLWTLLNFPSCWPITMSVVGSITAWLEAGATLELHQRRNFTSPGNCSGEYLTPCHTRWGFLEICEWVRGFHDFEFQNYCRRSRYILMLSPQVWLKTQHKTTEYLTSHKAPPCLDLQCQVTFKLHTPNLSIRVTIVKF